MRTSARNASIAAASILLALCMTPLQAFAATSVSVNGAEYNEAANGAGSKGGTWNWDGANDMQLVDYNGGAIASVGDLDITSTGDTTISSGGDISAIDAMNGNISITNNGTMTVDGTDAEIAVIGAINSGTSKDPSISITNNGTMTVNGGDKVTAAIGVHAAGGISITNNGTMDVSAGAASDSTIGAVEGDISIIGSGILNVKNASKADGGNCIKTAAGNIAINGTTVNVDASCADNAFGIVANKGNIDITNATVSSRATASGTRQLTYGIVAIGTSANTGIITITNSDVTSKASNPNGQSNGIIAFALKNMEATPRVNIVDSSVIAEGGDGAILAFSKNEAAPGTISITGSTITSPAGAHVQDVAYAEAYKDSGMYGQTIGTGSGTITEYWDSTRTILNPNVAASVTIVKNAAPSVAQIPVATQASAAATSVPKTADEATGSPLMLLMLAAAGGALFVARRRTAGLSPTI